MVLYWCVPPWPKLMLWRIDPFFYAHRTIGSLQLDPFFWPWAIKSYDSGWNESIGGPLLDWRAFSHLSGSLLHRVHLLLHFLHIATLCSPAERWLFCRLCSLVGRSHFFWNAENPPFFCLCRLMSHLKNSWHGSLLSLRVLNGTDTHGSGVKTWRATLAIQFAAWLTSLERNW